MYVSTCVSLSVLLCQCVCVYLCVSLFLCSCLSDLDSLYVSPLCVVAVQYQSRAGNLHAGSAFVPMMSVVEVLASLMVIRMCEDGGKYI